jgi:ribosomal protein S6
MQYELFYLIGDSKESSLNQIKEEVKAAVIKEGGVFQEPEILEKRKMAYAIKGDYRGTYVAQRFEMTNDEKSETGENIPVKGSINSINKNLNLNRDILRFMIVKADELPELKPREIIRREERRPTYSKKPTPAKNEPAKEKQVSSKEAKSIDEKLDEILNI